MTAAAALTCSILTLTSCVNGEKASEVSQKKPAASFQADSSTETAPTAPAGTGTGTDKTYAKAQQELVARLITYLDSGESIDTELVQELKKAGLTGGGLSEALVKANWAPEGKKGQDPFKQMKDAGLYSQKPPQINSTHYPR
ncbi:hypothetical protein [Streptomyces sp. NPDC006459]|uniref:hypothetical protein n=1 Tax=Streptomyces sp. NPDC006459 TaxID=3154303 RepID=UPI0033A5047E